MIRLISIASLTLALTTGAGQAQQSMPRGGSPQSLERCKQLASERGFSSAGGIMKGQGRAKREFVINCMRGKQI